MRRARDEQELLQNYAWVDRDAGIARIPIERAMAILAERGWPETPSGETFRPARRSLTAP